MMTGAAAAAVEVMCQTMMTRVAAAPAAPVQPAPVAVPQQAVQVTKAVGSQMQHDCAVVQGPGQLLALKPVAGSNWACVT